MRPSIDIVTAVFNGAKTIKSCIQSVELQTIKAKHFFIDGLSDDGTLDVIRQFSPNPVIISERDKGLYDAMNKGILYSSGDVIGFLNSDDFYANSDVLCKVTNAFENQNIDACYGDLAYIDGADIDQKKYEPFSIVDDRSFVNNKLKVVRYWKANSYKMNKFFWGWMPPHPTFFVRRRIYEEFGFFNLSLGTAADYELMLRFLVKNRIKVTYIPEILVFMRAGGVSNASLANRFCANRMDRKAWEINGLKPYPWTIPLKPVRKIAQYFLRPYRGCGFI